MIARFKIKNDRDVQFILRQVVDQPKVYVIVLSSQQLLEELHETNHKTFIEQEWNQFYPSTQQSFDQLMTFQFVATHGSNPLFYPNIWSGTCAKQHMNTSTGDNVDT